MKKVAIAIGVFAAAVVIGGAIYEYQRVCCARPRIPLDQYWSDRIKVAHDRFAAHPSPSTQ